MKLLKNILVFVVVSGCIALELFEFVPILGNFNLQLYVLSLIFFLYPGLWGILLTTFAAISLDLIVHSQSMGTALLAFAISGIVVWAISNYTELYANWPFIRARLVWNILYLVCVGILNNMLNFAFVYELLLSCILMVSFIIIFDNNLIGTDKDEIKLN